MDGLFAGMQVTIDWTSIYFTGIGALFIWCVLGMVKYGGKP